MTKYTLQENKVLGILKSIFAENYLEKWSQLPDGGSTRGSTTPGTLVRMRFKSASRLVGYNQTDLQNQMLQFPEN